MKHTNVLAADGSAFLTFLGSYNIFIAPICSVSLSSLPCPSPTTLTVLNQIIAIDYFIIKRGNIHVPSLFAPSPGSLYYYTKGWNLKALGSWVCAATFGIPGLVGSYHPTWVGSAATDIYQMGWIITFAAAAAFYFSVNLALPAKVNPDGYSDIPSRFEGFAATDGYLDGDALVEFPVLRVHEGRASGSVNSTPSNEVSEIVSEKV